MNRQERDIAHAVIVANSGRPRSRSAASAPAASEPAGSLPVVGSGGVVGLRVEIAEALLDRADDMLRRADVMLDGWQQARNWCNDLIDYRRQMASAPVRQPEPNNSDVGPAGTGATQQEK